jgi:hypothetical protein
VLASSGGAPALRMAPGAVAVTGGPPRDGGGSALLLQWGKTAEGAHLWFLYRGESLGAHGEMPKIHPSNESKIAPKFVTDSIGFGS